MSTLTYENYNTHSFVVYGDREKYSNILKKAWSGKVLNENYKQD